MVQKPLFYPDGTVIGDATDITIVQAAIASQIRTTGYAYKAIPASAEYNEMFKELSKWVKWLEQNAAAQGVSISTLLNDMAGIALSYNYYDLGLVAGNVGLTGATGTVTIKSGKYFQTGNRIHLDIVITIASLSGTLTDVAITLPDLAKCIARYVGYDGAQFLINNTNGTGAQSIPCTAGFYSVNNVLVINRQVTALNTFVPFLVDSGNTKFTIEIDYEINH